MHYKLLTLLLLLTSFNSFSQTLKFITHRREVYTQDRQNAKTLLLATDNLMSQVSIDSTSITILTLTKGFTLKDKSTFRIGQKRSYLIGVSKYQYYKCGKYLIVLDYVKQSLTILCGKRYKPRKQPVTIIPATIWYTRTTRIIYYGMFM